MLGKFHNQIQDEFWEFAQSWELSCYLDDVKEKGKENE